MTRLCRKCRSELGTDDDRCATCGASNPVPLPWYTYPLGFLIVCILALLLVDFAALGKMIGIEF